MSDLLVIVPSRERPQNVTAFIEAWQDAGSHADLLFGFDDDDATIDRDLLLGVPAYAPRILGEEGPRLGMCGTLNKLAIEHAPDYFAIGFAGDDHRFRTPGATATIVEALRSMGTGLCYGDDLIHGERLPTAVFITSDIIRTLGYMAPPALRHLYLDNAWLELGHALDAIRYLPDVIIEHMHPIAGKAPSDEGYERVNSAETHEHDRIEFERWRDHDLPDAVDKIKAARG